MYYYDRTIPGMDAILIHLITFGTKYSRMDQAEFVEDSL